MRRVVVVKRDMKTGRIGFVSRFYVSDVRFRSNALFLCRQHDGGAMSVISTNVSAVVTTGALKANPYVCLHLLKHMSQM